MGLLRIEKYNVKHSSAGRAWGFNRIKGAEDGKTQVYMTRAWIGRLRFHCFHRGDQDPDCHDHPWAFWTFPLRSYVEEVLTPIRDTIAEGQPEKPVRYQRRQRVVKAFRLHYRPAEFKHRVLGLYLGGSTSYWLPGRPPRFVEDLWHSEVGLIPTIVWRGGFERKWGFTKERSGIWCWVPWKKYIYDGGKNGPCE